MECLKGAMQSTVNGILPLANFVPEVPKPPKAKKLTIKEKGIYTAAALLVFLACSRMPLYGIPKDGEQVDLLMRLRAILLSSKGSLMELGISPLMNSSLIIQLVVAFFGTKMDFKKDKPKLQRLLCIFLTVVSAFVTAFRSYHTTFGTTMLVAGQLFTGGAIAMYLDELLESYGLVEGMGSSLFSGVTICEHIIWHLFSPMTYNNEVEGALIALVHRGMSPYQGKSRWYSTLKTYARNRYPNMLSFIWTVVMFAIVIYLQALAVFIPMTNRRGQRYPYRVKLYSSTAPVIFLSQLTSNFAWFASFFNNEAGLGKILNVIVEFTMPPPSYESWIWFFIHLGLYIVYTIGMCTFLSKVWSRVGEGSSHKIAEEMKQNGMTVVGHRDSSTKSILNRNLHQAALFGGFMMGSVEVLGTLVGSIVHGSGILLVVNLVSQLFEVVDDQKLLPPALRFR